jgi:hypothetical protein
MGTLRKLSKTIFKRDETEKERSRTPLKPGKAENKQQAGFHPPFVSAKMGKEGGGMPIPDNRHKKLKGYQK